MKDVYFCMLTNNQSTLNHKIPFYTAKSYHSTILVRYEGPGVSRWKERGRDGTHDSLPGGPSEAAAGGAGPKCGDQYRSRLEVSI